MSIPRAHTQGWSLCLQQAVFLLLAVNDHRYYYYYQDLYIGSNVLLWSRSLNIDELTKLLRRNHVLHFIGQITDHEPYHSGIELHFRKPPVQQLPLNLGWFYPSPYGLFPSGKKPRASHLLKNALLLRARLFNSLFVLSYIVTPFY